MKILKTSEILVPGERQRKIVAAEGISELAHSISTIGLLHPIVVRGTTLVAGFRRLRAIKSLTQPYKFGDRMLDPSEVPATDLGDIEDTEASIVELSENVVRVDLSWRERVMATARVHELLVLQGKSRTMSDTARVIFGSASYAGVVSSRVSLAEHMDKVANADSEVEAKRTLLKALEATFTSALGAKIASDPSQDFRVECIDYVEGMRTLEPGSVDILATDPPYLEAGDWGRVSGFEAPDWGDLAENLAREASRVCRSSAVAWVFCSIWGFRRIFEAFAKEGWESWRYPIIWYTKGQTGVIQVGRPTHSYECIFLAVRGTAMVSQASDHIEVWRDRATLVRPFEKPEELWKNLLGRYHGPGYLVLDPFCGVGNIIPAARAFGMKAVCFDTDPEAIGIAKTKL